MGAESIVYAALNVGSVTALVGQNIFPDVLPQDKDLPAVVYSRAETTYLTTIHSMAVLGSDVTVEVYCMGLTKTAADGLADVVEVALAQAQIRLTGRRPDYSEETATFATILTCEVWT